MSRRDGVKQNNIVEKLSTPQLIKRRNMPIRLVEGKQSYKSVIIIVKGWISSLSPKLLSGRRFMTLNTYSLFSRRILEHTSCVSWVLIKVCLSLGVSEMTDADWLFPICKIF